MLKSTLFRVLFISLIIPLVSACDLSFGSGEDEKDELHLQLTLQAIQMTLAAQPQKIAQPDLPVQPPPANPSQPVDDKQSQPSMAGDTDTKGQDQLQPAASSPCLLVGVIRNNNFPNGIELSKNDIFETYWEVTNIGSCTWDKDFSLILTSGDPITTMESIPIGQSISPGGKAQVYIRMMAGDQAGTYTSYWKVRSSTGQVFGGGSQGDGAFPISMTVLAPANVPLPPAPAPNFEITDVEWVKWPDMQAGACPVTLYSELRVSSNGPGEAGYRLYWVGGQESGTMIFTTRGTQTLRIPRVFSTSTTLNQMTFEITWPDPKIWGSKSPSVTCYDPHYKTLQMGGTIEIKDDEVFEDEKKTFNLTFYDQFSSSHTSAQYSFRECVGGEVTASISALITSQIDGSMVIDGVLSLSEGTNCGGMIKDRILFNATILPMQTIQIYKEARNNDEFGGDYAKMILNINNYHVTY